MTDLDDETQPRALTHLIRIENEPEHPRRPRFDPRQLRHGDVLALPDPGDPRIWVVADNRPSVPRVTVIDPRDRESPGYDVVFDDELPPGLVRLVHGGRVAWPSGRSLDEIHGQESPGVAALLTAVAQGFGCRLTDTEARDVYAEIERLRGLLATVETYKARCADHTQFGPQPFFPSKSEAMSAYVDSYTEVGASEGAAWRAAATANWRRCGDCGGWFIWIGSAGKETWHFGANPTGRGMLAHRADCADQYGAGPWPLAAGLDETGLRAFAAAQRIDLCPACLPPRGLS